MDPSRNLSAGYGPMSWAEGVECRFRCNLPDLEARSRRKQESKKTPPLCRPCVETCTSS